MFGFFPCPVCCRSPFPGSASPDPAPRGFSGAFPGSGLGLPFWSAFPDAAPGGFPGAFPDAVPGLLRGAFSGSGCPAGLLRSRDRRFLRLSRGTSERLRQPLSGPFRTAAYIFVVANYLTKVEKKTYAENPNIVFDFYFLRLQPGPAVRTKSGCVFGHLFCGPPKSGVNVLCVYIILYQSFEKPAPGLARRGCFCGVTALRLFRRSCCGARTCLRAGTAPVFARNLVPRRAAPQGLRPCDAGHLYYKL